MKRLGILAALILAIFASVDALHGSAPSGAMSVSRAPELVAFRGFHLHLGGGGGFGRRRVGSGGFGRRGARGVLRHVARPGVCVPAASVVQPWWTQPAVMAAGDRVDRARSASPSAPVLLLMRFVFRHLAAGRPSRLPLRQRQHQGCRRQEGSRQRLPGRWIRQAERGRQGGDSGGARSVPTGVAQIASPTARSTAEAACPAGK